MLIAQGNNEGKKILVLGFSGGNLRRLKAGDPIVLRADTHQGIPEDMVLFIFAGETERSMIDALADCGVLVNLAPEVKGRIITLDES